MSILIKNIIWGEKSRDIYVKDGRIEKIADFINKKAKEKIDGEGQKAVLPGLINSHSHAAMSLLRGYADDLPLVKWLEEKIWPLEKNLTEEDIYWGTKLAILEMLKTGTTCFNDMYWRPEAAAKAVEETGIRAVIGLTLADSLPLGQKENIEKYWQLLKKKRINNLTFSIAPHSIYMVSKENLIWAMSFAKRHNLTLHMHLSETEKEATDCLKKHKMRPVEYLDKIGFLNQNCIFAHSVWLSDKEIEALKKNGCNVVHCPCSNMKLGSGIFPYSKIKKAGINMSLGTDSAASNNNLDLFEEMKFASLLAKINQMSPLTAPAFEVFEMATKKGAEALKINSGEIKEGKLADLILIDLNQVCLTPGHNLISNVVYAANGSCVTDVICHGKILMRNKAVQGEKQILEKAKLKKSSCP